MSSYTFLAGCYDMFTRDVDYEKRARFISRLFSKAGARVKTVIDLAGGTGSMAFELAKQGMEVTLVDNSPEMLAVAMEKLAGHDALIINQDISKLDLYTAYDGAVCCLDSINYLTDFEKLKKTFYRLFYFIKPGGVFVFDVNTRKKFEKLHGQTFVRENDDFYCVWQGDFNPKSDKFTIEMDIFEREKDLFAKYHETHRQRAYSHEQLAQALDLAGFDLVSTYAELRLKQPGLEEERIFYTARRRATR